MDPPSPEELIEIANEWEKSRPNIPPPKPVNVALLADSTPAEPKPTTVTPEKTVETIPPGDFQQAPSLAEYGAYGDKGADAMIKLATLLETKVQYQRALLAWERVIDTSTPNKEQRDLAVRAIQRLRKTLPPWNPDPKADIQLTLHAGATLKDKEVLISALDSTASEITDASHHILKVDILTGETSAPVLETPPISFMADPKQPQALNNQISAGVYSLLKTHLSTETSFSPLPEYPDGVQPNDLLKYHVTRLMWREFVNSMKE